MLVFIVLIMMLKTTGLSQETLRGRGGGEGCTRDKECRPVGKSIASSTKVFSLSTSVSESHGTLFLLPPRLSNKLYRYLLQGFLGREQQHHLQQGNWKTLEGETVDAPSPGI